MAYYGIDISEWQGAVNWQQVKSAVDFVILREGYRQKADARFFEYVNGAKTQKVPILGVYHFLYCINEAEAKAEAQSCLANLKRAGIGKGCTIFADLEYDSVDKAAARGVNISKALCTSMTRAFLDVIRAAGYSVGIYTNQDYYNRMYETDIWAHYTMWLADYRGTAPAHPCPFHQTGSTGNIPGIKGNVDTDYYYAPAFPDNLLEGQKTEQPKQEQKMTGNGITGQALRQRVCDIINGWIGGTPGSSKHYDILNTYNAYKPLARGYAVKPNDAYCATTVSAAWIRAGIAQYTGTECGVDQLRQLAAARGYWTESDAYRPKIGDAVIYDWQDSGIGENVGYPEHIGIVTAVMSNGFRVTEGNMGSGYVGQREMEYNGRYIRGFITPNYDEIAVKMGGSATQTTTQTKPAAQTPAATQPAATPATKTVDELATEVIRGIWGNSPERAKRLRAAGYDPDAVQARVNARLKCGAQETIPVFYTVKKGDTLTAIARKYGTTPVHIALISKINNPNLIYPGQVIRVQ